KVVAKNVGDRCLDRIRARPRVLTHYVAGVIDDISVVAGPADHGVFAHSAIKEVVTAKPLKRIVAPKPIDEILFAGSGECLPPISSIGRHAGYILYRDCNRLRIYAPAAVRDLDSDGVDIVGSDIGRVLKVWSRDEAQLAGYRVDHEAGCI